MLPYEQKRSAANSALMLYLPVCSKHGRMGFPGRLSRLGIGAPVTYGITVGLKKTRGHGLGYPWVKTAWYYGH